MTHEVKYVNVQNTTLRFQPYLLFSLFLLTTYKSPWSDPPLFPVQFRSLTHEAAIAVLSRLYPITQNNRNQQGRVWTHNMAPINQLTQHSSPVCVRCVDVWERQRLVLLSLWWKESSRFLVWSFRQCIHQPSTPPSAANAACSAQLSAICSQLRLHRSENFYFGLASAEWSRGGASLNLVISFVCLRRRQQVKGRNLVTRKFSFCAIDHAEQLDFCFIWS